MQKIKQEKSVDIDGVNLLVSLLLRYPEIETISVDPKTDLLKLTFTLDKTVLDDDFEKFKTLLINSINAYHYLEELETGKTSIETEIHENILFLHVLRDMETVSQSEIKLISKLINAHFGDAVIKDEAADLQPDTGDSMQEEFIDHMFGNVKLNHLSERIIGLWEEGRVLVFNK